MTEKEIRIIYHEAEGINELTEEMCELVMEARKISDKAYSPYSGFSVGAAVRLANGKIITGNNQENAAYPSGLCAERTALFYANANFPEVPVEAIAISAHNARGIVKEPVKPCGSCRQVMLETEIRFTNKIKIILDGQKSVYIIDGVDSILPMSFKPAALKG
jgi:cytidine deaminase